MKNESKKNNGKYIIIIMNIIVCLSLSSCSYGELSRTDRESYGEVINSNFKSDKWQKYMVNDVLFTLSIMENNPRTYEVSSSFQKFRIYADAYKEKSDESKVTINSIKLEGEGKIKFVDRYEVIDKEIEFVDRLHENITDGGIRVIEELNEYNMRLNDKSKIKVTLNVTVEDNGEKETSDIEFLIVCRHVSLPERLGNY